MPGLTKLLEEIIWREHLSITFRKKWKGRTGGKRRGRTQYSPIGGFNILESLFSRWLAKHNQESEGCDMQKIVKGEGAQGEWEGCVGASLSFPVALNEKNQKKGPGPVC